MKAFVASVATFLVCGFAHGQAPIETTINVLAVELPPGTPSQTTEITQFMANLASHWPNPNNITVTLVNGGTPIYLDVDVQTNVNGNIDIQLQRAKDALVAQNRRGTADIVLFFSNYAAACGYARMDNWDASGRHAFIPNASGLDLDGADTFYAAIIHTATFCAAETALHEFGHLFSAGHSYWGPNATPQGYHLLNTNHAWWVSIPNWPFGTLSQKTIMAQGGIGGIQLWQFSHYPEPYGTDNFQGIAYTARSLANYRTGIADPGIPQVAMCSDGIDNDGNGLTDFPNDGGCSSPYDEQEYGVPPAPGCGLTAPIAVTGIITGLCVPSYPYTSHRVSWIDTCPSATTSYQIWYSQNAPYVFGWSVLAPVEDVIVWGANSDIKVKACNGSGCSVLSASTYTAISGC